MRNFMRIIGTFAAGVGGVSLFIWDHRKWKLKGDAIKNPDNDPFLTFAQKMHAQGRTLFPAWTTENEEHLQLAEKYFSAIPIPRAHLLKPPVLTPVEILPLENKKIFSSLEGEPLILAVGGPSAALWAFQMCHMGKPVFYVTDNNLPEIWSGSGFRGVTDVTGAPAYVVGGYDPVKFIWEQFKSFLNPARYDKEVLQANFPQLNLNCTDWLRNPQQWSAGYKVAKSYYILSRRTTNDKQSSVLEMLAQRMQASVAYLEALNEYCPGIIRATPRGSLLVTANAQSLQSLAKGNQNVVSISKEAARAQFGVTAQGMSLALKKHDFIFHPRFMQRIQQGIRAHGGGAVTNWRLNKIMVDPEGEQQGIAEFVKTNKAGKETYITCKFSQMFLSLGATPLKPNPYPQISVTGVSINALIFGAKLKGGAIICNGKEVVPLSEPVTIHQKNPKTGEEYALDISFVRMTAAGSVGPADRGKNWYTYDGRYAVHLLENVRQTFPDAKVAVLSVRGCNRLMGVDGTQMEKNPFLFFRGKKVTINSITLQAGAGGAGLTQMGFLPHSLNPNLLFTPHRNLNGSKNGSYNRAHVYEGPISAYNK